MEMRRLKEGKGIGVRYSLTLRLVSCGGSFV